MAGRCALIGAVCPETGDLTKRSFCPFWWETLFTNEGTGETKLEKGCGVRQLPVYLNETWKRSAGAAASAQQARDSAAGLQPVMRAVVLTLHESLNGKVALVDHSQPADEGVSGLYDSDRSIPSARLKRVE